MLVSVCLSVCIVDLKFVAVQAREYHQTDGQLDGCYQMLYLTGYAVGNYLEEALINYLY